MLQIKKVVIMQSYLVAFLFCNHFRLQYSYIEFCDSMVLVGETIYHINYEPEWVIKPILNNCISRVRCQVSWELYT